MRRLDRVHLRKSAAWGRVTLLAVALAVGVASTASATQIVNTDSSWLATNTLPDPTWSSDLSFDTTGWTNAYVVDSPVSPPDPCFMGASCIWYDNQNSATQFAWLRKTFTISDPISAATLFGGIDDDADIYVNGTQVLSNHDGLAGGFTPIDVTALLIPGVNLIAVAVVDNFGFGQNHLFAAQLQIETPQNSVPEPASLFLVASGLAGLTVRRRRKLQN